GPSCGPHRARFPIPPPIPRRCTPYIRLAWLGCASWSATHPPTGASLTNGSRANFSKQAHPPLPSPQCYVTAARASLVGMATPTTTCAEPSAVPRDRSTPLFSLCVSNHSTDQTIARPAPPVCPSAAPSRVGYTVCLHGQVSYPNNSNHSPAPMSYNGCESEKPAGN